MKNRTVFAALFGLCCLVTPEPGAARTWRVNHEGTGDAQTIQGALDSCSAGDSVLVGPGTYSQSTIDLKGKSNLTILGEAGAESTALTSSSLYIMDLGGSSWVTVRGFLFENGTSGILLNISHDCFIDDNVFRNMTFRAVYGEKSSFIEFSNNLVYSNAHGIVLASGSNGITLSNNTIVHNTGGEGFFCDGPGVYLYANIIAFNNFGVQAFCNLYHCNDVFGNGTNYITDPTGTNGTISVDPLFCGASPELSGNYFLQSSSPCAPGNHPGGFSCGVIGRSPVNCEVSIQKKSWGSIKAMYR